MKANMDYEELRNSMSVQGAVRVLKETNCYGTMDIAKNVILKALESRSEKPNKWIPISKETPKKQGYYITSTIYSEVYCDYWNGDNFDRAEAVLAWQELPLPYKAESEDENE